MNALRFELGKVKIAEIRERMVGILTQIDKGLADQVAAGLGIVAKVPKQPFNHSVPADEDPKKYQSVKVKSSVEYSESLSMKNTKKDSIATRVVAFLAADGVDEALLSTARKTLESKGAVVKIIAPKLGFIKGAKGEAIKIDESFLTTASVLFDAVFIPEGNKSIQKLIAESDAVHFINEAYKHCKAIASGTDGVELLKASYVDLEAKDQGVVINKNINDFVKAIAQHRFWERESQRKVPA